LSPEPVGVTGGSAPSGSGGVSPAPSGSGSSSAVAERSSPAGVSSSDGTGTSGGDDQPVPFARFKEVNDKYAKTRWAEDFGDSNPEEIRAQVALAKWANDDPRGFYEYYSSQLRAHGILPPPSEHANGNGRQPAAPEGPPGPDYRDPQTGLTVYSAEQAQKLVQYYIDQQDQKWEKRLGPTEKFLGSAQVQMRARNEAAQILQDARQWPHFETNRPAIFDAMKRNPRLSLETAYRQVVVPTLEARARQDVIASTEAKTGATTISPSSSQGSGREDLTKVPIRTLLRREFQKRGIGR
jgi:hypothetical protein